MSKVILIRRLPFARWVTNSSLWTWCRTGTSVPSCLSTKVEFSEPASPQTSKSLAGGIEPARATEFALLL